MADVVLSVVACLLCLGALIRFRDLRPGVPAGRRAVALAVWSLAAGTVVLTPVVFGPLQEVTGVPDIQEPVARTAIMAAALSAQSIFLFSAGGGRAADMVRRRIVVLLIAVVTSWVAFSAAPARARTDGAFLVLYGRDPWVGTFLAVYLLFLGWSFVDLLRAWRRLSGEVTGPLRTGLGLLACGAAAGCGYVAFRLVDEASLFLGWSLIVQLARIACVLLASATGLLAVTGVLWSSGREVVDVAVTWGRAYRAKERLYPLWRDLVRLRPAIALEPVPGAVRERLGLRDVRWRLYRRVIEIRDGRLALLPYLRSIRARRGNRAATPDENQSTATQEGQALALAVLSARQDPEPTDVAATVDAVPAPQDVAGEVAYLSEVSRAYSETLRAAEVDVASDRADDVKRMSS